MMLGEQDVLPRHTQLGRDNAAYPKLLAQGIFHGVWERTPGMGKSAKRTRKDAVEFEHRALIKYHRVELAGFKPGRLKAVFDRAHGKSGIVFAPGEPLFLDRGYRHAVDNQCRGCVVVMC